MKSMTATDARKHWFRLLDEVVEGEEVLIERDGVRLVLRLAEPLESLPIPDYRGLIRVQDAEDADQWGWDWDGSPVGLKPRSAGLQP